MASAVAADITTLFGAQKGHFRHQSEMNQQVWCAKRAFPAPKWNGAASLVRKKGISGTKVEWSSKFGVQKGHFRHQSGMNQQVWCEKRGFLAQSCGVRNARTD